MCHGVIQYSREDVLGFVNHKLFTVDFHIADITTFTYLSKDNYPVSKRIKARTKRGCRGGKQRKLRKPKDYCRGINTDNLIHVKLQKTPKQRATLPSVLLANCRSLNNWKRLELQACVVTHSPDVICLTETWLDNAKEQSSFINGYSSHFSHREGRIGGGVAIYITNALSSKTVFKYTSKTLSTIWALVRISGSYPIIVASIYHPPGACNITTIEHIETTINQLSIQYKNCKIIIAGDFNHLPLDFAEVYHLRNLVNFPTRNGSHLDCILTDIEEYRSPVELPPLATSDHSAVLLKGCASSTSKYIITYRRPYNETIKNDVLYELACTSWTPVLAESNVNKQVTALHSIVNQILDHHCPIKSFKVRKDKPQWLTPLVKKILRARDRAFKKGCSSWKVLRALAQRVIRNAKRRFIEHKLNNAHSSRKWWNTVKSMEKATNQIAQHYVIENKRISPADLCNQLNDYYLEASGELINQTLEETCSDVPNHLQPVSIGEVKQMLQKLKLNKATSTLDYPIWVSKYGCADLCVPICHIFNTMLSLRKFPNFWKQADVFPVPKTTSPEFLKDFRPISLLFHVGKLAEEIIISKMQNIIATKITNNQYGYKRGVSTTDALLHLLDDFTLLLDKKSGKYIQTVCLDFSKAFDRLQPEILLNKMLNLGFSHNIISLIKDFLTNRKQRVALHGNFSNYNSVQVGAPQGTKLGPLLWLIYINDLSFNSCHCLKYADDTTIFKPMNTQHDTMQSSLDEVSIWSTQNNMLLNASKTAVVNVSLRSTNISGNTPMINDEPLTFSSSFKFLGVTVDEHLTFNDHISKTVSKCRSRIHFMRCFKRSGMSVKGLKLFYLSKIRPILTYASPAWFYLTSKENLSKLERVQKTAFKVMLPDFISYEERLEFLQLHTIEDYIEALSKEHFSKIMCNNDHPLYNRLAFNNSRTSSRYCFIFKTVTYRTEKRKKSFFPHFMSIFNSK